MKKIFQLTTLLLASALLVVSCAKQEQMSTEQFDSTAVLLKAYGPQPVVRGGTLRFVGSNLDKVVSVTIPEDNVITDIEVIESGMHSEIRVTVPKETSAPGYPTLTLADGTVLTGKTLLTYDEPITVEEVTPVSVYPGDKITITGDYLNLIHEVVFTKNVYVSEDDFAEHTRYKIVVTVPAEAKTGKVSLGTVDQTKVDESTEEGEALLATLNLVDLEEEITIGTAEGTLAATTVKAGETVTVNGKHLKLVDKVLIGTYEVEEFEASDTKLTFALPADAPDGNVILVMASEVEVEAGALSCVMPTVGSCTPQPVMPGSELTVKGTDLDLITSVQVPAVNSENEWVSFTLKDESLVLSVPADATGSNIVLHMANGKNVEVEYALVEPTIASFAPAEITAGDSFTVTGTDFQLVESVAIGGIACEFTQDSDTQLTVISAATATTGKIVLTLTSGKKISSDTEIKVAAAGVVQVVSMPSSASVGEEITLEGSGFMAIEAIYFGDTKITAYSERSDGKITFTIPASLEPGNYSPKFVLTTGEEETCVLSIEVKGASTIVMILDEVHDLGLKWSAGFSIPGEKFAKVPYGATMHVEYSTPDCSEEWYQLQLCENVDGWPKLEVMDGKDVIQVDKGTSSFTAVLSRSDLQAIYKSGLGIGGHAIVIEKIYFTYDNKSFDPIFVSDVVLVDWDDHGGHNGGWDQPDGWGGVTTELVADENGGLYLHVTGGSEDQKWTVCCNHQSNYTTNVPEWVIEDASQYVVKIDVKLEGSASAADMTFNPVFGDTWTGGQGAGFFPSTTGGEWITVTIDLGLTGKLDCSSGTNGFMAANVPTGMCLDNFRFSLK